MVIGDFSSIMEVAATLSIAFVAVEYIKSYTSVLCENFFDYKAFIDNVFDKCLCLLPDYDTLNHIEPIVINGQSTNMRIEKVKRKNESLLEQIEDTKKSQQQNFSQQCQTLSMASTYFFIFLVNLLLLFLGGLECMIPYYVHLFVVFFTVFFLIYLALSWFLGEKYPLFSSLKLSGVSFIVTILVSVIVTWALHQKLCSCFIQQNWYYALMIIVVFSYINFGAFAFKIWLKAKRLKNEIESSAKKIEHECQQQKKDVDELMQIAIFSTKLKSD